MLVGTCIVCDFVPGIMLVYSYRYSSLRFLNIYCHIFGYLHALSLSGVF